MKKLSFIFTISIGCLILFSFYSFEKKEGNGINSSRDIVLQFITYNAYGNNLYIDNVLTGKQKDKDVTVTSILNIPYDTSYSIYQSGTDTILTPQVTITNIGTTSITDSSFNVYLNIEPGGYLDSFLITTPFNTAQTVTADFSDFIFNVGTQYHIKAYTGYHSDSNRVNDTLSQISTYLAGFKRNVLFEEFTSNSSFPCANNNYFLDSFVNLNIGSVTAIKYHTNLLGRDSFYNCNPLQQDARRRFYFAGAVPLTIADGRTLVSIPYGDSTNLYNPYLNRISKGTPVFLTVNDIRIPGDSIRTTIDVNIISQVPAGNYSLRINAIERFIKDTNTNFDTTYGLNNEKNFYDVFRAVYPDTNGVNISMTPGIYQYQFTYHKSAEWVDSMIYTAVFIQDNYSRHILNCAKGRNIVFKNTGSHSKKVIYEKAQLLNVNYNYGLQYNNNFSDSIQTPLNVELFEAYFPPIGWKIFNEDAAITFRKFTGANGPTLGGSNAVLMDFFDYNLIGQKDSMTSKVYTNLLRSDILKFDWAYSQYSSSFIDSLIVNVSTDGGITFPREIFRRGGSTLATAPQTTSFFIPQNATQWKTFIDTLDDIVSVNNFDENIPVKFVLNQNYPNPFNPETTIGYEIPTGTHVQLKVFDILGREIITLVNERQKAGQYTVKFSSVNLASGIYFYRLNTKGFTDTKRMVVIK